MRKFGERKTIASLHNKLGAIKMEKRERLKYFNQIFLNILIKFPHEIAPTQSLAIEYYTTTITPSNEMLVKRSNRNTLILNFDEAENVESEISTYDQHPCYEETKSDRKNPLLLTKQHDKESRDIDNVVKMVKKLSNETVDLKHNVGEGPSKPQTFCPFFKKLDNPPQPLEPSCMDFNLDSFSKDKFFFSYHQQNHRE
jgi:hypothetical protein